MSVAQVLVSCRFNRDMFLEFQTPLLRLQRFMQKNKDYMYTSHMANVQKPTPQEVEEKMSLENLRLLLDMVRR